MDRVSRELLETMRAAFSHDRESRPDIYRGEMLHRLGQSGCPICARLAADEQNYFFWLLYENYSAPEVLDQFCSSLGFCATHAGWLATQTTRTDSVAYLHSHILRHALQIIGSERKPGVRGSGRALVAQRACPACVSRSRSASSFAWFFAKALEGDDGLKLYGQPGLLCMSHLGLVARIAEARVLERILQVQLSVFRSAARSLGDESQVAERQWPAAIDAALALVAGAPSFTSRLDVEQSESSAPSRNPIEDFARLLPRNDSCPACAEMLRARCEWIGWLDGAVDNQDKCQDLLARCSTHIWLCANRGHSSLGVWTARNALEVASAKVQLAYDAGWGKRSKKNESDNLWRRLRRRSEATGLAREILQRPERCPLCLRIDVAEERALTLLRDLLALRQHRDAFEKGHGLCVKHLAAILPEVTDDRKKYLLRIESAKLSCLLWELEEGWRKRSWSYRAETQGEEQRAWRRSLLRISGTYTP